MKKTIFTLILISLTAVSNAQLLTELPYGIIIGKTTNEEIEDRGVCEKEIKVSESFFRCEEYSMANGRFKVYSSQNEIVSGVTFWQSYGTLPKNWREAGLKMGSKDGVSRAFFLDFIEKHQAQFIKKDIESSVIKGRFFELIKFDIGPYHYEAKFSVYPEEDEDSLLGIEITESY